MSSLLAHLLAVARRSSIAMVAIAMVGDTLAPAYAATIGCPSAPRTGCVAPVTAFVKINEATPGRERMKIVLRGLTEDVDRRALGDPVDGSTRYDVCVYDAAATVVGALT